MIRYQWNKIKLYIEEAQTSGHITLQLPSPRDAELFTFAVYNYRRKKDHGRELKLSRDGNTVTILKPVEMYIRNITPTPTP